MPSWDSTQYLKFLDERMRPARDLLARVPLESASDVADLGCGPGNSTELLHERWPEARIVGVDSSPQMLKTARAKHPQWTWVEADAASWGSPASFDVVFSNAALHWLPDHATAFPRLVEMVRRGGVFAAQMPGNHYSPVRRVIEETAREFLPAKALQRLSGALSVGSLDFYYDVLAEHSSFLDIWETEYLHPLESAQAIVEWFRGSAMRPYLDALPDDDHRLRYMQRCLEGIEREYAFHQSKVLLSIRRVFMVVHR